MHQYRWQWLIGIIAAALLAGCAQTGQGTVPAPPREPVAPVQVP